MKKRTIKEPVGKSSIPLSKIRAAIKALAKKKMQIRHTKYCKNFPQTRIVEFYNDPSEAFIAKVQKSSVYTGPNVNLPEDGDTVPGGLRTRENGWKERYLSRKEALRTIETDPFLLHRGETAKREVFIDHLIREIAGFDQYMITDRSSLSDFRKLSECVARMKKKWGIEVCIGCLREADCLWRQADLIARHLPPPGKSKKLKHDKHCRNYVQTPMVEYNGRKLTDWELKRMQECFWIPETPKTKKNRMPPDPETIHTRKNGFRCLSVSEALFHAAMKGERWLTLHRIYDESRKRKAACIAITKAFPRQEDATDESLPLNLWCYLDYEGDSYKAMVSDLKKHFGIKVCRACLKEAYYGWRQIDLIERYLLEDLGMKWIELKNDL